MTLNDYLSRELDYEKHLARWLLVWLGVFFGGLCLLALFCPVLPEIVGTVVVMPWILGSLPSLLIVMRIACKKLSAKYGLVCPCCQRPFIAPRQRMPGKVLNMTKCRRCGDLVIQDTPQIAASNS